MYKKTTVCAKWCIPCIFFARKDSLQNAKHRFPKIVQTITFLPSGIICFYITNYLHELGAAARRITNKKVGKQKFCIENLLPDFNF